MKLPWHLVPTVCLLGVSNLISTQAAQAEDGENSPVHLYVREIPLKIFQKEVKTIAIEQADGTKAFEPLSSRGFNVEVVNQLTEPTSIHWHGVLLPPLMDGVPFVSQEPIPPGGRFVYKFPLQQSGTYWMHSHFGLQEQLLAAAPLILQSEEQKAKADQQYVVLLSDFSFKPPAKFWLNSKGA